MLTKEELYHIVLAVCGVKSCNNWCPLSSDGHCMYSELKYAPDDPRWPQILCDISKTFIIHNYGLNADSEMYQLRNNYAHFVSEHLQKIS